LECSPQSEAATVLWLVVLIGACQKPDRKGGQRCPCWRAGFWHDSVQSCVANSLCHGTPKKEPLPIWQRPLS